MNRRIVSLLAAGFLAITGVSIATAGSAGAQATPSSSCSHGLTSTQVGEKTSGSSNVITGFDVDFKGMVPQTHSQLFCGTGASDINNKAYFGIQLTDSSGHYVFFGIGTRAGDYDCGLTGAGIGHVVYTSSGGVWSGLSNEVHPGTDSHGCSSSVNFGLALVWQAFSHVWELHLIGNSDNLVASVGTVAGGPTEIGDVGISAKIINGVGYGGNSDMYGQNNGTDYLHAYYGAVSQTTTSGWQPLNSSTMGAFGSFSSGSYATRFAEGGTSDGMNSYTNASA